MTDIRTIRQSLKMTQRELAELTWRSDAATKWESEERIIDRPPAKAFP